MALPDQFPDRCPTIMGGQGLVFEDLEYRTDPEAINSRCSLRKLVCSSSMLDHQTFRHKSHVVKRGNPKPQVVILSGREILIEPSYAVDQRVGNHYGGRAYEAPFKRPRKESATLLEMNPLLRKLFTVS